MARYTQQYVLKILPGKLRQAITESLESCKLNITYSTDDYIRAQEAAGSVSFSQLVTIEILIQQNATNDGTTKFTCVAKNEELPLRVDNHCHEVSDLVNKALSSNKSWKVVETISG
jgi:hypothetical protein